MSLTAIEQEQNKRSLIRLIEEGFNKGRLDVVDELVSNEMKERQRGNPDGIEGMREVITTLRRGFPDFYLRTEDMAVTEDRVWARFIATGTNTGSFMGNPPTRRKIAIDVIDIVRFSSGKIVEHWGVPDQLGAMLQLSLLPSREGD